MLRVVVDTIIIVSGTFWCGTPLTVLQGAENGLYTLLLSSELLEELRHTLNKPKFERVFGALGIMPQDIILLFEARAEKVVPSEIPSGAVRDIKDIPVLACAVGGNANVIVSGDNDLLTLGRYASIPILNALQFLEYLANLPSTPSIV